MRDIKLLITFRFQGIRREDGAPYQGLLTRLYGVVRGKDDRKLISPVLTVV